MCGPLAAIASFAVSAASSVASFVAAEQEQKAVAEASRNAYAIEQQQIGLRQAQEQEAASQKLYMENIKEARAKAAAEVSAAEGGVGGISVDNILMDVGRQAANNRTTVRRNLGMTITQLQAEREGSRVRNQSRMNSAPGGNPLSLIAGIGGAAVEAYGSMQ